MEAAKDIKKPMSSQETDKSNRQKKKVKDDSSARPPIAEFDQGLPKSPSESSSKREEKKKSDKKKSGAKLSVKKSEAQVEMPSSDDEISSKNAKPSVGIRCVTAVVVSPGSSLKPDSKDKKEEMLTIRIESLVTGFKPVEVQVAKLGRVSNLNSVVRSKLKIRHFSLYFNDKPLTPENSPLSLHGIVENCKVRLHVKAQSGTSDKEDVTSLLRLSKSLHELKSIISAIPKEEIKRTNKPNKRPSTIAENITRFEEERKTREKMAKLREKMRSRSKKLEPDEKKIKKKTRKEGGIAGLNPSPQPVVSPEIINPSSEECSDSAIETNPKSLFDSGRGAVTAKELLLFFDPPESRARVKFLANELFDPPTTWTNLDDLKHELKTSRCAFCHQRLPLALQTMQCRCHKVYCQLHRSPIDHCCAIDLKMVDRSKLQNETPKASPEKKDDDDDLVVVKGSKKPPSR